MTGQPSVGESHRLRLARCSMAGLTYHVTFRTLANDGLHSPQAKTLLIESLRYATSQAWYEVLGFVIMSNHVHLILTIGEAKGLADLLGSIKKWTARRINAASGSHGNLWQDGFHEHALRTEVDLRKAQEYVAHNPVKAGLTEAPGEYRWCWVPGLYDSYSFEEVTAAPSGSGEPSHGT